MSGDEQVVWVFRVAFAIWAVIVGTAVGIETIRWIVSIPERRKNRHFAMMRSLMKDQDEFDSR